jgi:F0F1-type ATP synthase epsilon subunit
MDHNKLLTVSVKGPKNELFTGTALSVTSINKKGKFDVLPYHTNFISLIRDYVIIREQNKKEITLPLQTGVMRVFEDKVNILIGI